MDEMSSGSEARLRKPFVPNMNQTFQFQVSNKTSVRVVLDRIIALLQSCTGRRAAHCLSSARVLPLNPVYFAECIDTDSRH